MLPNCKQAAEQVSENIDKSLTGIPWFKFKLHLMMCTVCRRYNNQLELSVKTVESLGETKQPSEELRENVTRNYKEFHCHHKHDE